MKCDVLCLVYFQPLQLSTCKGYSTHIVLGTHNDHWITLQWTHQLQTNTSSSTCEIELNACSLIFCSLTSVSFFCGQSKLYPGSKMAKAS